MKIDILKMQIIYALSISIFTYFILLPLQYIYYKYILKYNEYNRTNMSDSNMIDKINTLKQKLNIDSDIHIFKNNYYFVMSSFNFLSYPILFIKTNSTFSEFAILHELSHIKLNHTNIEAIIYCITLCLFLYFDLHTYSVFNSSIYDVLKINFGFIIYMIMIHLLRIQFERQADALAMKHCHTNELQYAINDFKELSEPPFYDYHPSNKERILNLKREIYQRVNEGKTNFKNEFSKWK